MYKFIFTFVSCILLASSAVSAAELRTQGIERQLRPFQTELNGLRIDPYGIFVPQIGDPFPRTPIYVPNTLIPYGLPGNLRPSCINDLCSTLTEQQCSIKRICQKKNDN